MNQHRFMALADAAEKLEVRPRICIEDRNHGAIGSKAPVTLTKSVAKPSLP